MSTHVEPLYRMIEDHLRAEIATGKHGVCALPPSGITTRTCTSHRLEPNGDLERNPINLVHSLRL
jgi:hypothetical protein